MDTRLYGHLRGPVTRTTPVAKRLADDLLVPFFKDLRRSRLGFVHPTSNALTDRATAISAEWRT